MAESKVNLGAGAPGGYSFGIAGYGVRPRVFVQGRQKGRTPSVALPEGDVLLDINNQNYYGKVGVDVTSPGGDTFGGAASGSYYRGSVDYPEELQRYGKPDRETYSARGIQTPEYSGYYQMEGGPRFEGYYRDMPEGSGMPDEYGGRVSYTIPFEDGGEVEPRGMADSRVNLGAGAPLLNQDPSYDYPMNPLLPFASRNTMDVDQLSTDYMEGDTKLIVPPILADMFNAAVRGGQMLRNRAPVTSEGILGVATDILPGSALVSRVTQDAAMAGPGAVLGMFAGQLAKTADLDKLNLAKELAKSGAGRWEIWSKTGWFQGPDKQWRFEIDDSGAKFSRSFDYNGGRAQARTAGEAYTHPELFKAYPELADIKVGMNAPGGGGSYNSGLNKIDVGPGSNVANERSVALHELQHAIQQREGFARGGSRGDAVEFLLSVRNAELKKLEKAMDRRAFELGLAGYRPRTDDSALNTMRQRYDYLQQTNPATDKAAYEWYKRLAGEVEARNVETRKDMTPNQRPPWKTLDVPEADQVVRKAEGGPVSAGLGSLPASENILTSGSISMSPSKYPNVDPRSAALGSRLLKQAGFRGDFNAVLKNADPRVVDQVNRIMPKSKVAAPSTGLGLFMPSTTKAI
jgi:hypothetical protein